MNLLLERLQKVFLMVIGFILVILIGSFVVTTNTKIDKLRFDLETHKSENQFFHDSMVVPSIDDIAETASQQLETLTFLLKVYCIENELAVKKSNDPLLQERCRSLTDK